MALPKDKRDAIVDRVAHDLHTDWKRRVDDLRQREVPDDDARKIVEDGLVDASRRWAKRK